MIPSEVAFLALGVLLGIAAGAAIVVITSSRPPTHEIRLTVTRDAVPRRASTLATDAMRGAIDGPAPGGPGDRRLGDREGSEHRTGVHPDGLPVVAVPVLPWPFEPAFAGQAVSPGAIAIHPEPDLLLAGLGIASPTRGTAGRAAPPAIAAPARAEPILDGLLAGDHRAMLRLVDAIAGPDEASRQAWDTLLSRLVDAVRERAIDLGLLDLPMGNPFWDTFTVDQCRQIVAALESTGRRFDGRSDWADGLVPTYRDLSRALADCGIEPRRIRAWPNSLEIAELFRGARVAAGEAVAQRAPELDAPSLQLFLGNRDRGLDELWPVWDAVRLALGAEVSVAEVTGS